MEEYVHLLIPSDPLFVPDPARIEALFRSMIDRFRFVTIAEPPMPPSLLLMTPSRSPRFGHNPWTGETISIPSYDRKPLQELSEIPEALTGLTHAIVCLSGKWPPGAAPIQLYTTKRQLWNGDCFCEIRLNLRPQPNFPNTLATFTDPWVGTPWADAFATPPALGPARFWIEFSFGKWLFPRLGNGFDLLTPELARAANASFDHRLVQTGGVL